MTLSWHWVTNILVIIFKNNGCLKEAERKTPNKTDNKLGITNSKES